MRGLYALHVSFIVLLTLEIERLLKDLYGEGLTDAERLALRGAVAHLESEGFLEQAKVLDDAE
ncbi:hypothetical protein [Sorangium sp. So ce1182]|uniref:hypothetical protein n=1 Tax=Sorangium sp. So ce1182 TaxID=3133334 RepID=UPI003F5E1644